MNQATTPIPVTVIGGYLGAGKTTLVNHLLRKADGLRIAVLVNEFGELPIDSDLIEAADDNVISIAGGCICCSYGSDLMASLLELPKLEPAPEHVLIESSGVALPGSIASSVGLLPAYRMDAVVVVADGERIKAQAADHYLTDTIERQLGDANLVLLNKCDRLSDALEQDVRDWLAVRSPGAQIVDVEHGMAPLALVLGAGLYSAPLPDAGSVHAHFYTCSFDPGELEDPAQLAKALTAPALGLARAKGVVRNRSGELKVLHVVGNSWLLNDAPAGVEAGGIVCIGVRERVNREKLDAVIDDYSLA